jgi:hypothetical protein
MTPSAIAIPVRTRLLRFVVLRGEAEELQGNGVNSIVENGMAGVLNDSHIKVCEVLLESRGRRLKA